jgi:hypothetical protein
MRQYLIGLAAAMAVAAVSAPAMANCGGCAPVVSYSSCAQVNPCGGYGYGGGWGYARLAPPVQYYAVQPQYYYVNQGPTYTGPGMFAPVASYQQRAVAGWDGYSQGYYGYNGGPYANPSHHYYHGMPAVATPTIYSYRRAYRPSVRYGYTRHYAPRYSTYAPRVYTAPRMYAPRVWRGPRVWAPQPNVRYGHRRYMQPRYSVAPQQYLPRQRVLRRYN